MAPTTPSNTLVGTTGNDILSSPGSLPTLVQGLQGNDTITLVSNNDWAQAGQGNDILRLTTGTTISSFAGSIEAGEGNDSLAYTGASLINGAYVGLNAGNDTLLINSASIINSTIGAGEGNDSINLSSAVLTTTLVNGGKGADTISLTATQFASATLQAGQGQDRVFASGLASDATSYIGLGAGTDSINLGAVLGTVAGGGLADTISVVGGALAGAVIFGDSNGVTTEGSGTGGSVDGADRISLTAAGSVSATTVYGAGANDTISFVAISGAALIDGGKGADFLGNTAADLSSGVTVNGGNGLDTITFGGATTGTLVLGGAGADSISLITAAAGFIGGSINGGEGNDTIFLSASAVRANVAFSGTGTINGGSGADLIQFNNTASLTALSLNVGFGSGAALSNVVYEAGDVIKLGTALNATTATNFAAAGPQLWVGGSTGLNASALSGLQALQVGSVLVYDSGDDLVIGVKADQANSTWTYLNVINGDDMLKTTAVGNLNYASSNFGFTLAQSSGALTITFS